MIRLATTRHYDVAFGCVEPATAEWVTACKWRLAVGERGLPRPRLHCLSSGHPFVARLCRWPHAWVMCSKEIAMAATEWAASHRTVAVSLPFRSASRPDVRERKREARQ